MIQVICLLILSSAAIYFLCINVVYAIMMFFSWAEIRRFKSQLKKETTPESIPAVSFIIPAFNEEALIVETIQTYLSLPQTKKEIIVINDGSHDQTFRLLQVMFQLRRLNPESSSFHSITYPELMVLEAPHMGKAQALNFGIAHARYDLICTMDADTIPAARGVEGCLRAFAQDPKLIAAGGVIQVLNTRMLKENSPVKDQRFNRLTTFQSLEYLRTFMCERLGWSLMGSTILISGAFCMASKEAIKKIGGFRKGSITEDLDLIIRLRKAYRGQEGRFRTLPITTCYTQAPRDLKHLMVQRMRWQLGLIQTLSKNIGLLFNPSYKSVGLLSVPYAWLVEIISPMIGMAAFVSLIVAIPMGWIQLENVAYYLTAGVIFNTFITLFGIAMDNKHVSKNRHWPVMVSVGYTMALHLGYKQLIAWWRFLALMKSVRKGQHWGEKPRHEIIHL